MRWFFGLVICVCLGWLTGCSTPYRPPVIVNDSKSFPGIAEIARRGAPGPVNVLLVHGMCTHDTAWVLNAITGIAQQIDSNYVAEKTAFDAGRPLAPEIQTVSQRLNLLGVDFQFSAFVWSPLTAKLKSELSYDRTGPFSDCGSSGAEEETCKPRRARFNGELKSSLMDDCLVDALIYEGARNHQIIREKMVQSLKNILDSSFKREGTTNVFISESLGSKILYDALQYMLNEEDGSALKVVAQTAVNQLGVIFMGANQLPVLSLADKDIAEKRATPSSGADPLVDILHKWTPQRGNKNLSSLSVVAFTDPNDLLSYGLRPKDYSSDKVHVANVLVSNRDTWFGVFEEPFGAHIGYLDNEDVRKLIISGWSK